MTDNFYLDILLLVIAGMIGSLICGSICFVLGWLCGLRDGNGRPRLRRSPSRQSSGKILSFSNRKN